MAFFKKQATLDSDRLRYLAFGVLLVTLWIVGRLFYLQVVKHDYYALFALNSHEIYQKLHPTRGSIYLQDSRTKQEFPAAVNKDFYLVYAIPKDIAKSEAASTTSALVRLLGLDAGDQKSLGEKLSSGSSYAVVARKVPEESANAVNDLRIPGIHTSAQAYRYYPEETLAASVLGFAAPNDAGQLVGRYGVESYWDKSLAGQGGFAIGEKAARGSWITLADRTSVDAENGTNLLLTIDRTLEFKACERLKVGMNLYHAKSAALVLMNPKTGAVLAMCSEPDFDPNNFSKVTDVAAFNNTAVYSPYEPGSVFKSFTMAAALDLGLISPNTEHTDPCFLKLDGYTIHNALLKCYGKHTMTEALENSVNTTLAWVETLVTTPQFKMYIEKFGFGQKTGVELNTELAGDISSLSKRGAIFGANGSFGQGLTATPLQLAAAYSAIANNGKLPKPYVVEEVRYPDGRKTKTSPTVDQIISSRAAKLLSGMLVSVVENHYKSAKIDHYYVAGKTGTAQVAENGKYSDTRTIQTFAGFAPAEDPQFVLIVKYEEPDKEWAEQSTIPVFKDVMSFALTYYGIDGTKADK